MPRTLPRLLHALPAYAVNGIAVATGIAVVHALIAALAGVHAGQLAIAGAVCSSLADLPGTGRRNLQRVWRAALLGTVAAALVAWLRPWPAALGVGLAVLTWASMMAMAWGPRAGPVSFAPVLALVFSMAVPRQVPATTLLACHAAGALGYLAWAAFTGWALQRRYRTLALAGALRAMARLLGSRAALLEAAGDDEGKLRNWVGDEAALAEALQAARDQLFDARPSPRADREAAMLLHVIDLRDVLLASRLDLDLIGDDEAGRWVRQRLAQDLRRVAAALQAAEDALRGVSPLGADPVPAADDPFAGVPLRPDDPRMRLVPVLGTRLHQLDDSVRRIHGLLRGQAEPLPVSREDLQLFVSPDDWPLQAVRAQLALRSPVMRHALRAGLALGAAFFIAKALPWASHPHWLVLSVAVVLRGNLEQTLARRNARVLGTLLGCVLVLGLAELPLLQAPAFLVAVGVAHSFVTVRYLVTATAATVMALVQSHLVDPAGGFAIYERAADTLLGAALAWAFSYVLPSWERRSLPRHVTQALTALRGYAQQTLMGELGGDAGVAQRLARRQAYDALGTLAAALQRGTAEPASVRPPMVPLAQLLDHGHRLMAHLSAIRGTRVRRAQALQALPGSGALLAQANDALQAFLGSPREGALPVAPAAPGLASLPGQSPADEPLPWLDRRLQLALSDAHAAGRCARVALAEVRGAG